MGDYDMALKPLRVRFKGVFDFEGLYDLVYEWLKDRQYIVQEDKYKNKPDSPFGYEHEVSLTGTKKVDDYVKYEIEVSIHVRDGAEIEHDGKKLVNGRVKVDLNGEIEVDYQGKFEGSWFKEFLGKIYNKVLYKRELEFNHWDPLYYRLHGFQENIKKHLNMYADVNY